jgi:hypothetical protein
MTERKVIYTKRKYDLKDNPETRHIPNYNNKPLCNNKSMGGLGIFYSEISIPTCSRCILINNKRSY